MPKCNYCKRKVPLFHRVVLHDGFVCKDCFHMANFGGYGSDDGFKKTLEQVAIGIKRREKEIKEFVSSFSSDFGLDMDDSHLVFMYNGWTHSYMSIYYFNAFLNGEPYEFFKRKNTFGSHYHNQVKKASETCIFLQLKGYTYPSYFKIPLNNERQFFECLNGIKHMCYLASEWEKAFEEELSLKFKKMELDSAKARYDNLKAEYDNLYQKGNKSK